MDPIVLTVAQVAELLDCTPDTVAQRAARGELPGLQFGRSWVFPAHALTATLNNASMAEMEKRRTAPPARPQIKPVEGSEFGPRRSAPPVLSVVKEPMT